MSWIVQTLLRNSVEIHTSADIESDEYNDLIVLESKITELYSRGIITEDELLLIYYVRDGRPLSKSSGLKHKDKHVVNREFTNLCRKIAYYLGGEYTDEGYFHYLSGKYDLTYEQVEKLRKFTRGAHRHRMSRKIKNDK